jgi:hypothetical protein
MLTTKQALLELLGDRPVAYHPILSKALGGVIEAVFVSQLLYWTGKGKLSEGWIYKTQVEIEKETGLTRRNQETARKNLKELGVLQEKLKGVPATLHYRLDLNALADLVSLHVSDNVQIAQTGLSASDEPDCTDHTNRDVQIAQSIPETTRDYPETTAGEGTPPTRDYVSDVLAHAQKTDQAGVADPSRDGDQWLNYREDALNIYLELTGLHADGKVGRPAIAELAGEPGFDLQKWRESIRSCRLAGVSKTNIACMIDTYRAGGDYGAMQEAKRNGGRNATHRKERSGSQVSSNKLSDEQRRILEGYRRTDAPP